MKILSISALAGLAVLTLLGGCCDEDRCVCPEGPSGPNYFPLAVGNWWAFESDTITFVFQIGDIPDTETYFLRDTLTVLTENGGSPDSVLYVLRKGVSRTSIDPPFSITRQWSDTLRAERSGSEIVVWLEPALVPEACFLERPLILMRLPLVSGVSWVSARDTIVHGSGCQVSYDRCTMEVVGISETVEVAPIGPVRAAHMRGSTGRIVALDDETWWADGIGCVMCAEEIQDSTYYSRLVAYETF